MTVNTPINPTRFSKSRDGRGVRVRFIYTHQNRSRFSIPGTINFPGAQVNIAKKSGGKTNVSPATSKPGPGPIPRTKNKVFAPSYDNDPPKKLLQATNLVDPIRRLPAEPQFSQLVSNHNAGGPAHSWTERTSPRYDSGTRLSQQRYCSYHRLRAFVRKS